MPKYHGLIIFTIDFYLYSVVDIQILFSHVANSLNSSKRILRYLVVIINFQILRAFGAKPLVEQAEAFQNYMLGVPAFGEVEVHRAAVVDETVLYTVPGYEH